MSFDVDEVYRYLDLNGIVYTIRAYEVRGVRRVHVVRHGLDTGKLAEVELVEFDLGHVSESGFSSVEAWKNAVSRFGYGRSELFMYRVRLT